jgi:hypothetical protein
VFLRSLADAPRHRIWNLTPNWDPNPKNTSYLAKSPKTTDLQEFSIGETGFEPATARPPVREFWWL